MVGTPRNGFRPGDPAGVAEPQLSRQPVVQPESRAVVGQLPVMVRGNQEIPSVDQMGGVLDQQAPLAECLANQGNVPLGKVAHAAVDQLGAAAGRALGEIVSLEERRAIAPRGGIDRGSQARRPAANDDDVPGLVGLQPVQVLQASQ